MDVVGFSKMMSEDEENTLRVLSDLSGSGWIGNDTVEFSTLLATA